MHDAVDGGSRAFGCGGDRLTRGSCRCITASCTKSAFLCCNAIDGSPRAFECDYHSMGSQSRIFCLCSSVGVSTRVLGCAVRTTGSQSRCLLHVFIDVSRILAVVMLMFGRRQPPSSIGWRCSCDGLAEPTSLCLSVSAPEFYRVALFTR